MSVRLGLLAAMLLLALAFAPVGAGSASPDPKPTIGPPPTRVTEIPRVTATPGPVYLPVIAQEPAHE